MKNFKKISVIVFVLVVLFGISNQANALQLPGLYMTPTGITKNVKESFVVDMNLSASDKKVYAVEGTLSFKNLNCEGITVATGLIPQTAPTCANPYFLIGVPNGTINDTKIFEVKVSGIDTGDANINLSNIDVIGEGKSVSNIGTNGTYIIKSVPATIGSRTGTYIAGSTLGKSTGSKTISTVVSSETGSLNTQVLNSSNGGTKKLGENNPFTANAKDAFTGFSLDLLLILIIVCLSTYIALRENYLYKRNK